MATATLTYNLETLIGENVDPRRTRVWVTANVPLIVVDGTTLRPDDWPTQSPAADGTGSFSLVTTDSAINPAAFAYVFHIDYVRSGRRERAQWHSSAFPFTASKNLAEIPEAFDGLAISPEWQSEFRDEMLSLAASTAGDDLTPTLASNPYVIDAANTAVNSAIYTEQPSVNMYNPADADVQTGFLLNGGAGNTVASANYTTTGWIAVTPGQQVSVSQHRAIAFVQADKTTQASALINTGVNSTTATYTIPATTAYIRVSYNHPTYPTLMVNLGTTLQPYTPYASHNLYNALNPDVQPGYLLQGGGGNVTASAGYTTTGWIPVTPGQKVSVSQHRIIAFVQADKSTQASALVNTGNNATTATYTIPAATAYIRVSFASSTYATVTISRGTYLAVKDDFAQAVGLAVTGDAPVTVTKSGTALTLTSNLGGASLVQPMDLTGSANGAFTFGTVTLNGSTIHAAGDDITPIRTQMGTVGANHGYTCVRTFTNPDAKTTADLGSVWTDGSREYVLLAIDGTGKLVVGGSYTGGGGTPVTSADVAPAGNLTHVSGATHTGAIVAATIATTQLYPSIGRISVGLYVDGVPVSDNRTRKGWVVEVRESYEVLDYASIYDTAKANIGTTIAARTISGAVRVTNRFAFRGAECRVSTSFTELKPTTLSTTGAIQAAWLAKTGATLTRYLPGAGTQGGFNWNNGVDMTAYATTVNITVASLPAGEIAPAVSMDTLTESGNVTVGFALGYLPYGARSDDASRSSLRTTKAPINLWDMRSTKKQYPTVTSSETAGWGRLTVEGFRRYLSPDEVARVLASKTNAVAAAASLTYA